MGHVAHVEPLVERSFIDEGRSSLGVAGGSDPVGGPGPGQLVESCGPCIDCIHRGEAPGGVHMADGFPPPQR